MSTTTNTAPDTSGAAFTRRLQLLSASAVGVIIVRSKETQRAVQLLHAWALLHRPEQPFRLWNCYSGWLAMTPDGTQDAAFPQEKILDPVAAIARIRDLDNRGAKAWEGGAFVMLDLQRVISEKHTGTLRLLLDYAEDFPASRHRLMIVVPDTFVLPAELSSTIPLLELLLPTKADLADSLRAVIADATPEGEDRDAYFSPEEIDQIVTSAAGLTVHEAETAFALAIKTHAPAWEGRTLTLADANKVVLDIKTDIVRNSEVLEYMPPVPMEDIGGLELLKEYLLDSVSSFTPEAAAYGADPIKGLALVGPPGTGKSACAKATASILNFPLVRMDVGKLFGSLVGESESRVRAALRQIVAMAPCVVLIDEVDKAGLDPRQGGGDSGVGKRVLGSILTFMAENKQPIVWVFTANRTTSLPPEMLRKGRLDEVFSVLLPTEVERAEILRIHLKKRGHPTTFKDFEKVVKATHGFIGAEIESVVQCAIRVGLRVKAKHVTAALLLDEVKKVRPISVTHSEDFNAMQEWAEMNARPSSIINSSERTRRALTAGQKEGDGPGLKMTTTIQPMRRQRRDMSGGQN